MWGHISQASLTRSVIVVVAVRALALGVDAVAEVSEVTKGMVDH